jgi:hypothetical protein
VVSDLLPGVPRSMKSIASKWEWVSAGEPAAWTTARAPSSYSYLSGPSDGWRPKKPSRLTAVPAVAAGCLIARVGRLA